MRDWFERHSVEIYLTLIGVGIAGFFTALIVDDWRMALVSAATTWMALK